MEGLGGRRRGGSEAVGGGGYERLWGKGRWTAEDILLIMCRGTQTEHR